jgi:hypothetical protein
VEVRVESPISRKRRERIERQEKERIELEKNLSYDPFGKDKKHLMYTENNQ